MEKPRRYSEEEKKQLLERYNALVSSGKNVVEAAKEIGVSYVTIRAWQKKEQQPESQPAPKPKRVKTRGGRRTRARKRPVKNVRKLAKTLPRATGKSLAMVMPNGYRIEGFSVEDLIKLLKALR